MMNWLRWHHGTSTDPKWLTIARIASVPVSLVVAVWGTLLESASKNEECRGLSADWNAEDVASFFGVETAQVEAVYQAMQNRTLDGTQLISWEKRNPKREREDDSTERVQRHREALKRPVTPRNATKHLDKKRLEKKREDQKEAVPSLPDSSNTQVTTVPVASPPVGGRDEAMDLFCERHKHYTGTAYKIQAKDAVHLTELRKTNGVPARASPDGWAQAVENYFGSPLTRWTLAGLAVGYPTFRNSKLDRFKTPVSHGGAIAKTRAEQRREQNDNAVDEYLSGRIASPG